MQDLVAIWLSLFACLAVIGVAGVRLPRHGDIIADKSGPSRGWVGLTPLAGGGFVLRSASRVLRTVSWISLLLIMCLLNTWFLYLHG